MLEMRSVRIIAGSFLGVSRVKNVLGGIHALFTFVIGFASLLAPGEH
jgi:hypothetical protein